MSREWKPGDVAMVRCSDGVWRLAMCGEARVGIGVAPSWMFPDHSLRYVEESSARPLVVIDPEEREAVERLRELLERMSFSPWACGAADCIAAALREFANPKPPRPDEPQGLGAVVEDEDGARWARARVLPSDDLGAEWVGGTPARWADYEDIKAVRVVVDR